MKIRLIGIVLCISLFVTGSPAMSQPGVPFVQPADLIEQEMQVVYLGNLARLDQGVPPLRWNASMTQAARWFAWDSVENRPDGYCGHIDTLNRWPSQRVPLFGYGGICGAENSYCGYMLPQDAVNGWMNSPGHRANLLDPNSREIGMGYYRRAGDGRGYLTQDFGHDPAYPPVIINNEALNTATPTVNLYIYDREPGGGFAGLGPATEMQVSHDMCFDVPWQPYQAERAWTLRPGQGWRTVYVKTRDAIGRTTVASDTIYLGEAAPRSELGLHLASSHTNQVTLYGLNAAWPLVQFSPNWFVDDQFETFSRLWGNGRSVTDAAARGGTAFRLEPGDYEASAWVWTTQFFHDVPLMAYVRLKVDNHTTSSNVARFAINGGGTEYGPLILKGSDFDASNVYQEFPLAFTFHQNPDNLFLIFQFWQMGQAQVTVDGVTIFTMPQATQSPLTWMPPGGNYRGGGVWVRYRDAAGNFSAMEEGRLVMPQMAVAPQAMSPMVQVGSISPVGSLTVRQLGCPSFSWTAQSSAAWLTAQADGDAIRLVVNATGMSIGLHQAVVTIRADGDVLDSPINVPVQVRVVAELYRNYLPLTMRSGG